jgi:outer membrane autotransporter protein
MTGDAIHHTRRSGSDRAPNAGAARLRAFKAALLPGAVAACLMVVAGRAAAQDFYWTGTTADYATSSNWTPGGVPGTASDTARFAGDGSLSVDLGGSAFDVDGWIVSGAANYTFDNGTINFGPGGFVNSSSGAITLGADLHGGGATIVQDGPGVLGVSGGALGLLHDVHLDDGFVRLDGPGDLPVDAHLTFSGGFLASLQSRTLGDLDSTDSDWMQLSWAAGKEGTIAVGAGATVTLKGGVLVFGQNSTANLGAPGFNGTIEVGGSRGLNFSGGGQKLVIAGGTTRMISGGAGFFGAWPTITVDEGATLDFGNTGSDVTVSPLQGAGTVQNINAELVIDGGTSTEFTGDLKNVRILTLDHGANLTLTGVSRSGTQDPSAGTVVRRGSTLTIDNAAVLGNTPVIVAIGSTLNTAGDIMIDNELSFYGTQGNTNTLGSAGHTIYNHDLEIWGGMSDIDVTFPDGGFHNQLQVAGDGDTTFTSVLKDGNVIKTGAGTLSLMGDDDLMIRSTNANTGQKTQTKATISLEAGTLVLGHDNAARNATIVMTGSTLELLDGISSAAPVVIDSQTSRIGVASGTATQSGVISETFATAPVPPAGEGRPLEKIGDGELVLTGQNTFTGPLTISAGTLSVDHAGGNALADAVDVDVADGATFDILTSETIAGLTGAGVVTNNGGAASVLSLRSDDDFVFDGQFSDGASALGVAKLGTGTLTLAGTSTHTGPTALSAGTLMLIGSMADSAATVGTGATLAGTGTAGTTIVEDGGLLAPGNGDIGTLAIDGDLTLQHGSVLDFEFGAPGTQAAPGAGDSVHVGGDLVLDGATLDVGDAGGFGLGVYRLFDYTGTLTESNGGIALGSTPIPASGLSIQRLTGEKHVDLVNTTGLALNFWNANGLASSSQRGGGDGTWSATSPVWTDANGSVTSAMQPQPGFAIFAGQAGTVTVDDAGGTSAVATTGMQFAADGYRLAGDTLTLVADADHPAPVEIRVGDGGAGSENWTTTIDNAVAGTDGLRKTGAGTLVLGGTGTYTGGTEIDAGVLSVSADANLGDLGGAVTLDGGTLRVTGATFSQTGRSLALGTNGGAIDIADAGNRFLAGQAIGGAGGLAKTGAGTLRLGAANTYAGATRVDGGTLSLEGAGSIAASSSLGVNGGVFTVADLAGDAASINNLSGTGGQVLLGGKTLKVAQADAGTYAGTIGGGGAFVKDGAGTLTLSGDSHDGAGGSVRIEGGVLALAGAGSIESRSLAVDDGTFDISGLSGDGTLVRGLSGTGTIALGGKSLTVDQGVAASFGGTLDGTGSFIKSGDASLAMTGDSSGFAGVTSVQAGSLSIQAEHLGGDVLVGTAGSFSFDQAADATFSGALSGSGAVVKSGAATLAYDGDGSAFTGTTTIAAGGLVVGSDAAHRDAVLGGSIHVADGARLAGIGTVGTTTVAAGATIAPGNSIGTLNVAGDIAFDAGSIYEVEVDPAGTDSDRIHATGTATLDGGSVIHVGPDGNFEVNASYTILTADGGVAGTFDAVASDFAFLEPTLAYGADRVELRLARNDVDFGDVGHTPNQHSTGEAVDSLGFGNPVWNAVAGLGEDDARSAFDQLSGEVHASVGSILVEDSRFVSDAAIGRLRDAFATETSGATASVQGEGGLASATADTDRAAVWVHGFGASGDWEGDDNAAPLDRSASGLFIGTDGLVTDNLRLGLLAGYSRSDVDVDRRASSSKSRSFHFGVYGGSQWSAIGFRFGAAYSWHDLQTRRSVSIPGYSDKLGADYGARTAQAFGELGYRIGKSGTSFEPFVNLAYVKLDIDGFTEDGGSAALSGAGSDVDASFATLGVRASTGFVLGRTRATVQGMAGWRHGFGDATPRSSVAFANADAFTVAGAPISRNALVVGARLGMGIGEHATLGFSYSGQFARGGTRDSALRVDFATSF